MRYSLDERQIARLKPLVLGHTAARFIELSEDIDDVAPWDKVVRVLQADGLEIGRITMGEAFALKQKGENLMARDIEALTWKVLEEAAELQKVLATANQIGWDATHPSAKAPNYELAIHEIEDLVRELCHLWAAIGKIKEDRALAGSERGRGPGARAERRAGVPSPAGRGMKQAGAPSGALRERSSRVIERFEKWVESGRFEDRFGRILDALESPTGRAAIVLALIVLVLIVEALSRTR